jgi:hypothetical protein
VQKRPKQALSLLEILFTIGLLTVILVAFAAVYPAAYRLNRKSARATIAAKVSSAVGAEILALPFDPPPINPGQSNITDLSFDTNGTGALATFVNQKMRTPVPTGYSIRPQAIKVTIYGADTRFAQVQVTCFWADANSAGFEKSVTILSGKAENRDVR